jgi:hypothetical protein
MKTTTENGPDDPISPTYDPNKCEHEPYEDCLICTECGQCKESVDSNDVCTDCGGQDESDNEE